MLKIRMLKKTVSFILAAVTAIVLCFSVTPSFADSSEVVYHETEKEAAAELRTHMKQREEKVTIGLMGSFDQDSLQDVIGRLLDRAIAHTGKPDEGDYIAFQYASYKGVARTTYSGFSPAVKIEYTLSYYDDAEQEAEVDKKVSEIIEGLELGDKTDFEKIAAIHDYICDNVEYETESTEQDTVRTAYGALIEGKAVCQGYSVSLYRLLLEAGIDNRIIFGEGLPDDGSSGPHSWNIIQLGDEYYYIDVTWDDTLHSYDYFMAPADSSFEEDHIADKSYGDDFFAEDYPISEEEYKDEAVGMRGKVLKMTRSIAGWLREVFPFELLLNN